MFKFFFALFNTPLFGHHWTLSKPKNKFESLGHRNPLQVQGVHKVSLQFQKFITKFIKKKRVVLKTSCINPSKIRDITNLKQRITHAISTIDESMLQRTWQEIEYRLDVLCTTNGAHIEVY